VPVEAGWLREILGGPERSGLTTAEDLSALLTACHVQNKLLSVAPGGIISDLKISYGERRLVALLGAYGPGGVMHWITMVGMAPGRVTVYDPWVGATVVWTEDNLVAAYAGSGVVCMEPILFDASHLAQPGTTP